MKEIDLPLADLSYVIVLVFAKFKFAKGGSSAIFKIICNIQTKGRPEMSNFFRFATRRNTFWKERPANNIFSRLDQ